MAYLSYFERHSRNTVSINVLNSIRKRISINKELSESNMELLGKLKNYLDGNVNMQDVLTFHFRDSGDIVESIPMEIFLEMKKVFKNKSDFDQFNSLIDSIIKNKEIEDKKNYLILVEKLMDSIDNQTLNLEKSNKFAFEPMGF